MANLALMREHGVSPGHTSEGELAFLNRLQAAQQKIANQMNATHFVGERGLTDEDLIALGDRKVVELGTNIDGYSLVLSTSVVGDNGQIKEGVEGAKPSLAKASIGVFDGQGREPDREVISKLCIEARNLPILPLR